MVSQGQPGDDYVFFFLLKLCPTKTCSTIGTPKDFCNDRCCGILLLPSSERFKTKATKTQPKRKKKKRKKIHTGRKWQKGRCSLWNVFVDLKGSFIKRFQNSSFLCWSSVIRSTGGSLLFTTFPGEGLGVSWYRLVLSMGAPQCQLCSSSLYYNYATLSWKRMPRV